MALKGRFTQVCLIVLLAAALRFVFLHQFQSSDFYECPVLDMLTYVQQAQVIAKYGLDGLEVIWRPPLYPILLSLSVKYAGSFLPGLLIQVLLASLSAGLVYLVARRFVSERVALAGAALYAINWVAIFFSVPFEGTSLFVFLLLLALWLMMASEERRSWLSVPAGLAAGLAALVRTEIMPIILVWALWMILRKRFSRALMFLLAAALPILPITIENYRMTGQFIPVTAIGGYNFFVGNNAQADGKTVWASEKALRELGVPENASPLENQSRYMNAALDDIKADPARFAGLILKKAYYLFNAYEISSNSDMYYVISDTSPLLAVLALFSFGILLPLAVVGIAFGKYDRRAAAPVFLFALPFALLLLAFFINARFRSPLIPILCVFAAAGAASLWNERKNLLKGGRAMLLTFVFFLAFCNTQFFGIADPRDNLDINLQQAFAFHSQQKIKSCEKMLAYVLTVDPQSEPAMHLLRQLPEN